MTVDEGRPFQEREQQQKNPVPVTRRDARSKSLPTAPTRHTATGQFRPKQGGRRGQ